MVLGSREAVSADRIDLFWIPLGAAGHVVAWSGRLFEAAVAARHHRRPLDLYHCALVVTSDIGRFAIELAPAEGGDASVRGVVATGPVGLSWAGRIRLFRYEIRCRADGLIPDLSEAVQSPVTLSTDPAVARLIPRLVEQVPPLTWGRDESGAGEMWNSNSVISWLILRAGIEAAQVPLPSRGRAPGWDAGIAVARAMGPVSVSGPRSLPLAGASGEGGPIATDPPPGRSVSR